jgi:hypothetical protein
MHLPHTIIYTHIRHGRRFFGVCILFVRIEKKKSIAKLGQGTTSLQKQQKKFFFLYIINCSRYSMRTCIYLNVYFTFYQHTKSSL